MSSFINYFDNISIRPELKINGNSRYYTGLGIFIGISAIFTSIILSSIFINDVLSRMKINMIYNLDNKIHPVIDMSLNLFGFTLTDSFGNEQEDYSRIFEFQVKYFKYTFPSEDINSGEIDLKVSKPTVDVTDIPLKNCTEIKKNENDIKNMEKSAMTDDRDAYRLTVVAIIAVTDFKDRYQAMHIYEPSKELHRY